MWIVASLQILFSPTCVLANCLLHRWPLTQHAADKQSAAIVWERNAPRNICGWLSVELRTPCPSYSAVRVSGLNSVEPLYHRVKPNGATNTKWCYEMAALSSHLHCCARCGSAWAAGLRCCRSLRSAPAAADIRSRQAWGASSGTHSTLLQV